MVIRKYLDKQYLDDLKNYGRLMVGNIHMYRYHEDLCIRDELEAVDIYRNNGKPVKMGDVRKVLRGSSINIEAPNLTDDDIFINGGNVLFNMSHPNAFVFCVSGGEIESMKTKFTRSNFFVIKDPILFGNAILSELRKKYTILYFCYDWVNYVKSKNLKDSEIFQQKNAKYEMYNLKDNERVMINLTQLYKLFGNYFTKEEIPFGVEKEFRFVFKSEENIEHTEKQFIELDKSIIEKTIGFED